MSPAKLLLNVAKNSQRQRKEIDQRKLDIVERHIDCNDSTHEESLLSSARCRSTIQEYEEPPRILPNKAQLML